MKEEKFCKELISEIEKNEIYNRKQIEILKKKIAKKYKLSNIPLNSKILEYVQSKNIKNLLKTKPTRTLSGVSVVAIMSKPAPCPGKCIYCPSGSNAPQSYTGFEPAALRAKNNEFDPYKQVKNRLNQLKNVGHSIEKNELIIMGGTFPSLDTHYQETFVKRAFDAFNQKDSKDLKEAQKTNEKAKHRIVGLTIETRPDYLDLDSFLGLGATRVELGVQSIFPKVLKKIKREHNLKETILATRKLKDCGYKVLYQMMPGLPGSSLKKDIHMFKKIFENPKFKPDMLKIYPTLVIKGTKLYTLWKKGQYIPIDEEYTKKLLIEIYKIVPKWLRIMRIQRDIPANFIEAGPKKSNLREIIEKDKIKTKEIRFREIGHKKEFSSDSKNAKIMVEKYKASKGNEYFISMEDIEKDIIFGFGRLRIPSYSRIRPEINTNTALLRELHIYGSVVPIGKEGNIQHSGLGRKILAKAEEIAKKEGRNEMIVLSGIGVKEYYKKQGYIKKGPYMCKKIL